MSTSQHPKNTESILIVDDDIASLRLLTDILSREGYRVRPTEKPQSAIESAIAEPPSIILLDVIMPEMSGFELSQKLKQDERTRDIPIIFVSGLQEIEDRTQGFETGGVDYISKPFQEADVLARVRTHMELHNMQQHLEELVAERTAELQDEIDERKVAEKKLQKSESLFRATFEQAAVGIAHVSLEGSFLRLNQKFCDIVGYSLEEMLSRSFQDITHPEDLDKDLDLLQQLITGDDDSYNLEKRYICKDSSIIWVSLTVKVIRDYDSSPQWFVSVVEDISERRRISEELVRNELRYRNLVNNSLVGVFNTSLDGEFLFVNDALVRIYEFDNPEQMMALGSLPRWDDPKQRARMLSKLQADGIVTNFEAETITHTGRHVFVLFSAKLQDELITGMVMDITDRKQAEQEILEYQQHLKALTSRVILAEEQERRRIATDLHDNVSQTLALTRLQLATVAKSIDDAAITEQLDELSQTLRDSLRETRNLIFDLSSPTINELGLGDAIREWVERKISPHHDVVVKVIDEPEMNSHCKDHNALLLRNVRELLTNVVKHARADRATVHLEREGTDLRVTVKDNGVGIPQPELLKRNISKDGGLGLFSIEERLTDLGGVMAINSKVNHGTTIVMTVPCLESTQETAI